MTTLNLSNFSAISLNQLNAQASLMDRQEQKYFLHQQHLPTLLEALREDFAVLQIAGESIFSYDNVYMDTKNLDFYHDHNNSKPGRIKVRTRHYVESDVYFLEFKQKINGHLRKFRYEISKEQHGQMDKVAYDFVDDVHMSLLWTKLEKLIFPSIGTHYKRVTLMHKTKAEKITLDFNVGMSQKREDKSMIKKCWLSNIVIIESKTNEEFSIGQQLIEENNAIKVETCTKYCIGNNLLGNVTENDKFVDVLDLVEELMKKDKVFSKRKLIKKVQNTI